MSELDRIKNDRASLNALTEQFNATTRSRLASLPAEQLYDIARAFGVDPSAHGVDEWPDAIVEALSGE